MNRIKQIFNQQTISGCKNSLKNNTPKEVHQENTTFFEKHKFHFNDHKKNSVLHNYRNKCETCISD